MNLAIAIIRLDGGTQPRAVVDRGVIDDYGRDMRAGVEFPPVVAFYDGTDYWLADGFHRVGAAQWVGEKDIECDVRQGTREDAQWYSFGANQVHGLRRTTEDKQRAVKSALTHANGAGKSNSQIARHVGVDEGTVRNWRERLSSSSEIPKTETRSVTRGNTTYQQNTANIGRTPRSGEQDYNEKTGSSFRAPPPPEPLSAKRVWAAQETKHFTREFLRLLKSYEKSHAPVDAMTVTRNNGVPVGIEILSGEMREEAS